MSAHSTSAYYVCSQISESILYVDIYKAFDENNEDMLRELIKTHGVEKVVRARCNESDDSILRTISYGRDYKERAIHLSGMAKILLDSLESDDARYVACMEDDHSGYPPMFSAIYDNNIVMVKVFLDAIPQDRYVEALMKGVYDRRRLIEHCHDYNVMSIELTRLFIHKAEHLDDDMCNAYHVHICSIENECRDGALENADVEYGVLSTRELYTVEVILSIFESIERVYGTHPTVVNRLMKTSVQVQSIFHTVIRSGCTIVVNAMLRICECRYSVALLTTPDSHGITAMELAITIKYVELAELRGYVLTKSAVHSKMRDAV